MAPRDSDPHIARSRKVRIDEAIRLLRDLGMPRAQVNQRSALVLLALLDLKVATPWSSASSPRRGITPMMEFFAAEYGVQYKPNTRETVRRQTMHQFVQAGLAIENPDAPGRPTNSPKWCYQVSPCFLEAIRQFDTTRWKTAVRRLKAERGTLASKYAAERKVQRIPIVTAGGLTLAVSPGGQSPLIKDIIEAFGPIHAPGATLVYVGDTSRKWGYFDEDKFIELGIEVLSHGKMPDVIMHDARRDWLIVVEAVTSHGPMNPKRVEELRRLLGSSSAGSVFVSAFPDKRTFVRHLADIAWETEVWCADSPTHLVHFNGERFLGPYPAR